MARGRWTSLLVALSLSSPGCGGTEVCDNRGDDDGDGEVDCADGDCADEPTCSAHEAEVCTGGTDEDGDGDIDCADADCATDPACRSFHCGAFDEVPEGWTVAPGYRAVVVADAGDGLADAVALTFAGGDFGPSLYVSDMSLESIHRLDLRSGELTTFVDRSDWPVDPNMLTALVYDSTGEMGEPRLFVAEQGSTLDQTGTVFSVSADGSVELFTQAPGPGLDDPFCLAFSPGGDYPRACSSRAARTEISSTGACSRRTESARPSRRSPAASRRSPTSAAASAEV